MTNYLINGRVLHSTAFSRKVEVVNHAGERVQTGKFVCGASQALNYVDRWFDSDKTTNLSFVIRDKDVAIASGGVCSAVMWLKYLL